MKTLLRFFVPKDEKCVLSMECDNPVVPRVDDNVFLGDDVYSVNHLTYDYNEDDNSCMVDVMLFPYPEYYDDYDEDYVMYELDHDEPCDCGNNTCNREEKSRGGDKKEHNEKYDATKKRLQGIVDMLNDMGIKASFEINEWEF